MTLTFTSTFLTSSIIQFCNDALKDTSLTLVSEFSKYRS